MPVDKFGRMSDAKTRDTGVSLSYINDNYIRSDGGTPVSGSINMNGNTLYNVSDLVNPQDVATKEYMDNRPHIIAVQANYQGELKKGQYQFNVGGNTNFNLNSGFLIPSSGIIKKIQTKYKNIHYYKDINGRNYYQDDNGESHYLDDKLLGDNVFFTFTLFKPTREVIDIGTYRGNWSLHPPKLLWKDFWFEHVIENIRVIESITRIFSITGSNQDGDVLNIRTEIDTEHSFPSYLFSFLIELDL